MVSKSYRITATVKILILQILISFIGISCGFTWKLLSENNRWNALIYPGVKIAGVDLGGKSKDEARSLIEKQYINLLTNRKLKITTDNEAFDFECGKYFGEYDINKVLDEALNVGKDLGLLDKYRLTKYGVDEDYGISFNFNEDYVKGFIKIIEGEISKQPISAEFTKYSEGMFQIRPDTKGIALKTEQLEKLIKENIFSGGNEEVVIKAPVDEKQAVVTAEMLSSINTKISSFDTSLKTSSDQRTKNVELAANFINGKVIMPGETFSYNDTVGERTRERGFQDAPVIIGNKVESGLGGGICQVSTTLYNAILKTGINSIQRTKHSLPSSYVGLGLDATVSWNDIDFKFTNTLKYPIYIESYIEEKNLYVNIYSDSSLVKRTYAIKNEVYDTSKAASKVLEDSNLPLGQTYTIQKGYDGYKVKVIRDTYENGTLINTEMISNDFYRPVESIVKKGIAFR